MDYSIIIFVEKGILQKGFSDTPELISDSIENFFDQDTPEIRLLHNNIQVGAVYVKMLNTGSGMRNEINSATTKWHRKDETCKALMVRTEKTLIYIVENDEKAGSALVNKGKWDILDAEFAKNI